MAPRKCDISRNTDLTEKVVIALVLALLVCTGFHRFDKSMSPAAAIAHSTPAPVAKLAPLAIK